MADWEEFRYLSKSFYIKCLCSYVNVFSCFVKVIHFYFVIFHISYWIYPQKCYIIIAIVINILAIEIQIPFITYSHFFCRNIGMLLGFACSSHGKETAYNARDPGSIPRSERSPRERNDYVLQYSCLENSMDKGSWRVTVHVVTKSDMTERLTLSPSGILLFLYIEIFQNNFEFLPAPVDCLKILCTVPLDIICIGNCENLLPPL